MYISNKLNMHACSVAQLFLTLWDPMDCSLQDSSAHGIFQARILEWAVISFSRGSSWPRDGTRISCVGRWILHHWAMKESQNYTWGALKFTQLFPGLKHSTFKMSQAKILEHVTSGLHFPIHIRFPIQFSSVQWLSHFQLFVNHSTPVLPVHHHLPESTQTQVHWVSDAIQPSHPLSSPSPSALNLSQHQGLFKWVSSLHQVAKGLEFQLQHQSCQWTPRTDLL